MRAIASSDLERELTAILKEQGDRAQEALGNAVSKGIKRGASNWRKNAKTAFPPGKKYRKNGKEYTSGAYAKSIRSRSNTKTARPSGVAYSQIPGLPHLLEDGHAKVGGGRVEGRRHVAPAAEQAFDYTMDELRKELDNE